MRRMIDSKSFWWRVKRITSTKRRTTIIFTVLISAISLLAIIRLSDRRHFCVIVVAVCSLRVQPNKSPIKFTKYRSEKQIEKRKFVSRTKFIVVSALRCANVPFGCRRCRRYIVHVPSTMHMMRSMLTAMVRWRASFATNFIYCSKHTTRYLWHFCLHSHLHRMQIWRAKRSLAYSDERQTTATHLPTRDFILFIVFRHLNCAHWDPRDFFAISAWPTLSSHSQLVRHQTRPSTI